jgi:hypothetical protein
LYGEQVTTDATRENQQDVLLYFRSDLFQETSVLRTVDPPR